MDYEKERAQAGAATGSVGIDDVCPQNSTVPRKIQASYRMSILDWRHLERGSLRGFLTVELASGLVVHGLTVHRSGHRSWVGMPAKPVVVDGRHVSDAAGKAKWTPVLEIRDPRRRDLFAEQVLAALCDYLDAEPGEADPW